MLHRLFIVLFFALLLHAGAQVPANSDEAAAASLAAYEKGDHSAERIAQLLPQLADPARRNAVRSRLMDPLPVTQLVGLLKHNSLAVRLGALELLEEQAGGDFAFNPWNAPDMAENSGPLARWSDWASKDSGKKNVATNISLLGDDQRRGYLRDLLGQDDDKASRARYMLEADGLRSITFLEDFLAATPALPVGGRMRVRQAQYQIVLAPRLGPGASETARNLAFGSRDQLLSAISATKAAGSMSLPILRDFMNHADPLVRETTIDAILTTGGMDALSLVAPVLETEPDVNVIHGALRRLKDVPGKDSANLAASFLTHPDEDLLVSAIQTCMKLAGGSENSGGYFRKKSSTNVAKSTEAAIIAALSDPRWRVRVAALEYVSARNVSKASNTVLKLLDDPDEFVRFASIKTAAALELKSALPKFKAVFMANEAMIGPVLEGYAALDIKPDGEMMKHLAKASPEARIAAVRAAESHDVLTDLVIRFASDPERDVACAALRFLSADMDRVADKRIASLLVEALRSGLPEKQAAVLDRLTLPESKTLDPKLLQLAGGALENGGKTALDPLYEGFLLPLESATTNHPAAPPAQIPGAQAALLVELVKFTGNDSAPDFQFSAALALARAGQAEGLKTLTRLMPTLSSARRAAIAEGLDEPSSREALPLLQALLRDPVDQIREAAANRALSNDKAPALIQLVLDELSRPDTLLKPHEVYSFQLESIGRSQSCGPVLRSWAFQTLQNEQSSASLKILACISFRNKAPATAVPLLTDLVKASPSAWLRRAAAHSLGSTHPKEWAALVEALAQDTSPYVRETVPAIANRKYKIWTHHFDDANSKQDSSYFSQRSGARSAKSDPMILAALERLASPAEISPVVRFSALFALMAQSKPVDIHAMVQLLGQQPEAEKAPRELAKWFENSANQVGPGLRPLFSVIDTSRISPDELLPLVKRMNPKGSGSKVPVSFAALGSRVADDTAIQQVAATSEVPVKINRSSIPVVYFFKPGCRECVHAREMLAALKKDFPSLLIEEHNMLEADSVVLNQALCERFQVPSLKHNIAPSLFTQSGFLVREEILPQALAALLGKTADTDQNDAWKALGEPQIEAAKEQVAERYQSLTLPVVIGAGLLDGVNPCAFATIIFFLSYLQIARRSKREMLLTGAAFILGVFLAYLAAGLLLYKALATLHERFAGIQNWLNPLFAALALVAALLSFRDALRARRGRMDEMTLQLPSFLKDRIRGVIRTGVRARRFVIAAFFTGVAISFLELACTGQVYAPIVYQIQQGKLDAVAMLVIYNLAFISPLVVIFLLAYGGLRSESLIQFQKKHTFAVKIALGILFLLLGVFILLGNRLLLHGAS